MRYVILAFVILVGGCDGSGPKAGGPASPSNAGAGAEIASTRTVSGPVDGSGGSGGQAMAAIVDGQTVPYAALRPLLAEAAGGEVLAEYIIDQRVTAALGDRKLTISADDVATEKRTLLEQLSPDANQAVRLMDEMRQRRGLGERRFAMLLRRNAGLRKLVADEVRVTEDMVREAYDLQFGPRISARMILSPTLVEANRAMQRVQAGEDFAAVAIAMSTDRSKNQGGLLPDLSPLDPTFPKSIRDAVGPLEPGKIAGPVAVEGGFAILRCERRIPASATGFGQVAEAIRRGVRLRAENAAMQRRVRVMLEEARVTVLDGDLDAAWKHQRDKALQAP